eukprot:jgi/Psemu1/31749/gm1.31749_g
MRFRPLRIDYLAEAVEILREEQLREKQGCEQRQSNDDKESFAFVPHYKRAKRRRVIRILREPPEDEPPQELHKEDGSISISTAATIPSLPSWLSNPSDSNDHNHRDHYIQQVEKDPRHDKDNDNDNDNDRHDVQNNPLTSNNHTMDYVKSSTSQQVTRVYCTDSSDPVIDTDFPQVNESRRTTPSPSVTNGRIYRPSCPMIDYRIFYNTPWLLALISSIRRRANRKRICQYQYDVDRLHLSFHSHRNSMNDSFSQMFFRIQQQTNDECIQWQSMETSPKWLHPQQGTKIPSGPYCREAAATKRSQNQFCGLAAAPFLPLAIRAALSNGSFASSFRIGSRHSRLEARKRALGALVVVRTAGDTLSANAPDSDKDQPNPHQTTDEGQRMHRIGNQELISSPSLSPSQKLWETAIMTAHILHAYQQLRHGRSASNTQPRVECKSSPTHSCCVLRDASFGTIRDEERHPRAQSAQVTPTTTATASPLLPSHRDSNDRGRYRKLPRMTRMPNKKSKVDDVSDSLTDRIVHNKRSRSTSPLNGIATAHPSKKLFGSNTNTFASNFRYPYDVLGEASCEDGTEKGRQTPKPAESGINDPVGANNRAEIHEHDMEEGLAVQEGKKEFIEIKDLVLVGRNDVVEARSKIDSTACSRSNEDGNSPDCSSTVVTKCGPRQQQQQQQQQHQQQLPTKEKETDVTRAQQRTNPLETVKQKEMTLLQRFGLLSSTNTGNNMTSASDESNRGKDAASDYSDANDDMDALTATPARTRDLDKSASDDNANPSSPFEFPICSDDYEEETEQDIANSKGSWNFLPSSHDLQAPSEINQCNDSTQNKREQKRKRREKRKLRKREKKAEKRRRKETQKMTRKPQQEQRYIDLTEKIPNVEEGKGNNCVDNNELEQLETPKKLEDLSPAKILDVQRNPEHVLNGTNLCNSYKITSPRISAVRTLVQDGQICRNGEVLESKVDAFDDTLYDDPFYVSPEEIQQSIKDCHATSPDDIEASHGGNATGNTQNEPIHLLCSESFLENFGYVIADFARDAVDGDESAKKKSFIRFTDTDLMDACGADIETPLRGAILVSTLSQIQASGDQNGLLNTFLPRIVELASTARYHQLTVFLCIDAELDADVSQGIVRLQTAFMSDGGKEMQDRTKTSIQLTSRACLASCIARTVLASDPSPSSALSNAHHWLSDKRACERLKFLLGIIPTLSVNGALLWLDSSQSRTGLSSEHSTVEDKSVAWFQHCFQRVKEESNHLQSLLLPPSDSHNHRQLHNCISPYVPQQLKAVVRARLNSGEYS